MLFRHGRVSTFFKNAIHYTWAKRITTRLSSPGRQNCVFCLIRPCTRLTTCSRVYGNVWSISRVRIHTTRTHVQWDAVYARMCDCVQCLPLQSNSRLRVILLEPEVIEVMRILFSSSSSFLVIDLSSLDGYLGLDRSGCYLREIKPLLVPTVGVISSSTNRGK